MKLERRHIVRGGAQVTVGADAGNTVRFTGSLREMEVGDWLIPLIREVHAAAIQQELSEVVVDIRELEYANAAVWTCLVGWLRLLRRDERARYNLRVRSETRHRWQQVGIPALVVFGADRLVVE